MASVLKSSSPAWWGMAYVRPRPDDDDESKCPRDFLSILMWASLVVR